MALALARLLRETVNGEKGPGQRMAILEIAREFARLRRQYHQMERLGREQEIWEEKQAAERKAEMKAMEGEIEGSKACTQVYGNMLRREYCKGLKAGTLDPEWAAGVRELFARNAEGLRECGVKDLPINGVEPLNPQTKSK